MEDTTGSLQVRLLGPLRVAADGRPVTLPRSRKTRGLFAYLTVSRSGVSRDRLCRLLFADTEDPRASLRWCISRLRSALSDRDKTLIRANGDRIEIGVPLQTDIDDVQHLGGSLPEALQGQEVLAQLIAAEQAFVGGFLDGLQIDRQPEFEAWRLAERARFAELHRRLLRRIVESMPDDRRSVDYARRLVDMDGADEASWALLVKQLVAIGNLSDARQLLDLAHRELARDGVPVVGALRDAMRDLALKGPPGRSEVGSKGRGSRPVMVVAACEASAEVSDGQRREITAGLIAAATRVRLCTTRVPPSLDPESGTSTNGGDLLLRSYAYRSAQTLELRVDLLRRDSGASAYGWQISLDGGFGEPLVSRVERYFASHFEFDLCIALIGIARDKQAVERTLQDRFYLALPYIFSAEGLQVENALREMEAVVVEDPSFAMALCAAAWLRSVHADYNSEPQLIAQTSRLARKAVEIGQDDPFVLGLAAVVITHSDLDVATGEDLVRRALSLNDCSPMALIAAGWTAHYAGDHERCLSYMDRLDALDAAGPLAYFAYTCRAIACYQLGRHSDAEGWCRKALGHNSTFIVALRTRAASLVNLGRAEEAQRVVAEMTEIDPSENLWFFRQRSPYLSQLERDRLYADLRAAGLPAAR